MYQKSKIISLCAILILLHFMVDLIGGYPVDSKTLSFYNRNTYESNPSSSLSKEPVKSEISETVSKILRLMHSLSNKSILVNSQQSNFNLNDDVKKENNLKFNSLIESKVEESNRQLNEKLENKFNLDKIANKFINENINNENLNERINNDDRFNDELQDKISLDKLNNENNENNQYIREQIMQSPMLNGKYSLSAKYPIVDKAIKEITTTTAKLISDYSKTDPLLKFSNQMIIKHNGEDDSSKQIKTHLPSYLKQYSKYNEQIDSENKENKDSGKSNENNQLDRFELQFSKDSKRNLYDMVENEDEDNLTEEEHMHNYDISLLSDRELNRTLFDIQWLLNQNLSKQEMESKFSSKVRNNRNKIAQRMEYFDKLYRNIHQFANSAPTNVKRGEGPPQLSVVSPLDILRDKLILEIARRKIEQSKSQMKENEDYLKKIG